MLTSLMLLPLVVVLIITSGNVRVYFPVLMESCCLYHTSMYMSVFVRETESVSERQKIDRQSILGVKPFHCLHGEFSLMKCILFLILFWDTSFSCWLFTAKSLSSLSSPLTSPPHPISFTPPLTSPPHSISFIHPSPPSPTTHLTFARVSQVGFGLITIISLSKTLPYCDTVICFPLSGNRMQINGNTIEIYLP